MAFSRSDEETQEYVLSGCYDLLEWRFVQFLGSRQLENVCDTCNVMSRIAKRRICYRIIVTRKMKCPIDKEIVDLKVLDLVLEKDYIDVYTARGFYASRGCKFCGTLYRVTRHLLDGCDFVHAKCSRYKKRVNRWQVVEHRAESKFGLLQEAIEAI